MQTITESRTVNATSEVEIFSHTATASELASIRVDLDGITVGQDYRLRLYVNGSLFRPEAPTIESTDTKLTMNSLGSVILAAYDVLVIKLVGGLADSAVDVTSTILVHTDAVSESADDDDGPTTIEDAIFEAALGPQSVSIAGHTVNSRSIDDLIKAANFQANQSAMANKGMGLRRVRLIPPGCG